MNHYLRYSALIILCVFSNTLRAQQARLAHVTPVFQENRGQFVPEVKFLFRARGLDLWVLEHSIIYDLHEETVSDTSGHPSFIEKQSFRRPDSPGRRYVRTGHVIRMDYKNANTLSAISGTDKKQGIYNYFIGNDSTKWVTNAHTYSGVSIKNLYRGIDAEFYVDSGMPRYDLIIQPGTDPSQIAMMFNGQDGISTDEQNDLIIKTTMGNLEERDLFAYQVKDGIKQKVSCSFMIADNGNVRFQIGNYDHAIPLVIDPLIYSTYLGGAGGDVATSIFADRYGNAYITGTSGSSGYYPRSYPTTIGAYKTMLAQGNTNIIVTKLNASGTGLIYSTFIGGSGGNGDGISVDASGNAYIAGWAGSDFPITPGAYELTTGHSGTSPTITKLDSSGSKLIYSTFLNAIVGNAYITGIAVDILGSAYVTGYINGDSVIFPTTPGAFESKYRGGEDIFVTKLNPSGSGLIYSTCFGGASNDQSNAIAIDSSGNAYITGYSLSSGAGAYPTTPGAFQPYYKGGGDAFITKLNSSGTALIYSTYIGGSDGDAGNGIAVDILGNAYMTGYTSSIGTGPSSFPTTKDAFQTQNNGINGYPQDAFVTKLNSSGTSLIYSTLLGGELNDEARGIALDSTGNACITGATFSMGKYPAGYPTTIDGYQLDNNGGSFDGFMTKLNADGSALIYSTYFGGGSYDQSAAIAVDDSDNVYIAGGTESAGPYPVGIPVTPNAVQPYNNGAQDAFVAKFGLASTSSPPVLSLITDSLSSTVCDSADGVISLSNIGGGSITIDSVAITDPFHFLPGQLPLLLGRGHSGNLNIRVIPLTSGPLSGNAIIFYHTSDGAVHDTVIVLRGFATTPLAFGITLEPRAVSGLAGDSVNLEIGITGTIDAKTSTLVGLQALEISLDLNTDLLTPMSVETLFPGLKTSQLAINGDHISFTLFLPAGFAFTNASQLAEVHCIAYVTDTMATSIELSSAQFSASGGTTCFALGTPIDTSIFTLIPQCGDSTLMKGLRHELPSLLTSIIPNPANTTIEILLNNRGVPVRYQLFDALGTTRKEGTTSENSLQLNILDLPSGNYYLRISRSDGIPITKQVLIMR
jgi:hypothetical protein